MSTLIIKLIKSLFGWIFELALRLKLGKTVYESTKKVEEAKDAKDKSDAAFDEFSTMFDQYDKSTNVRPDSTEVSGSDRTATKDDRDSK